MNWGQVQKEDIHRPTGGTDSLGVSADLTASLQWGVWERITALKELFVYDESNYAGGIGTM